MCSSSTSLQHRACARPVDAAGPTESGGSSPKANATSQRCGLASFWQPPTYELLRRPAVFTLAVVWDSPQAPADAIRGTVEALGCEVDLSGVFGSSSGGSSAAITELQPAGVAVPPPYRLRCVICYFGHHYLVFALSPELRGKGKDSEGADNNVWLSFDDEEAAVVGGWADVCRAMVSRRLQPSLLFYEQSGGAGNVPL